MRLNSERLRIFISRTGITQGQLAELAGISRYTVNNICRGATCKAETAERIATALGVPVEKLEATRRRV